MLEYLTNNPSCPLPITCIAGINQANQMRRRRSVLINTVIKQVPSLSLGLHCRIYSIS